MKYSKPIKDISDRGNVYYEFLVNHSRDKSNREFLDRFQRSKYFRFVNSNDVVAITGNNVQPDLLVELSRYGLIKYLFELENYKFYLIV